MSFSPKMRSVTQGFSVVGGLKWRLWKGVVADVWDVDCAHDAGGDYVSPDPRPFVALELGAKGSFIFDQPDRRKVERHDMPGASFASCARPGDYVGMTGPGGGSIGDADWYLLAGDETALPAIARILEELPAGKQATVRIEVVDARDEQPLLSSATLDVEWLHRGAAEPGTSRLLENAVRAIDWPDKRVRVFAWAACEYRSFRAIRTYLRRERDLSRDEHLVVAYWRRGSSGDDARKETGD